MPDEHVPPEQPHEPPRRGHERSDASFPWIASLLGAALVVTIVVYLIDVWFFRARRAATDEASRSAFPLAPKPSEELPKKPRLEQVDKMAGIEKGDIYKREEAELKILSSYGTPKEGFVRVPIEQAIRYMAEQKLGRKEADDVGARANGLVTGGESNSGREFRKKAPWHAR
jgi:hypothetical protein